MLEGEVERDGKTIFDGARHERRGRQPRRHRRHGRAARSTIDGQFVANQRADGLIVALADRLDRLRAVGRRADPASRASPAGCWCRSRRTTLSNRPIVLPDAGEVAIEIVAGRDASANFDMQSLASLLHGDRDPRAPLGSTACASCIRAAGATSPRCARSCTGIEGGPERRPMLRRLACATSSSSRARARASTPASRC